MTVPEKLEHVTMLIKENRHQEALKELEKLESLELEANDRLSCQFQKVKILLQMDSVEDALNLAQHVIQEGEILKNNSIVLDAIITKVKALKRYGRLEESLESIEKGIGKLNMFQESDLQEKEESLINQLSNWERIIGQNLSKSELIELTQLDDLKDRMISKRLYRKEEEIKEYAAHARTLVEKWEKN